MSLWENSLVGVAIVMSITTSVVSLMGRFNVVWGGVMVHRWVGSVVSISMAVSVGAMRGLVVWSVMSPEVLVMWSGSMMGISVSVEAAMVWGSVSVSVEGVASFFSGGNGCNNCRGKEISHLRVT